MYVLHVQDMLLQNVSSVNLTYHGQSHFNSLCDEKNPPPLHMRDSSILLRSRVALFEDFLQSASAKVSAEEIHPSSQSNKVEAAAGAAGGGASSGKHNHGDNNNNNNNNTHTTEESLTTTSEVLSPHIPHRKISKHNSKTATITTYT